MLVEIVDADGKWTNYFCSEWMSRSVNSPPPPPPPNQDGIDLTPTLFDVSIEANEGRGCTEITFIDDQIALEEDAVFAIRLTIREPLGLTVITTGDPTITITDDDGEE